MEAGGLTVNTGTPASIPVVFSFFVAGDPLSWSRVQGKGGARYKNPKLAVWQGQVREAFLQDVAILGRSGDFPLSVPAALHVQASFRNPHWVRRDADNVLKAVMDALKGAAWVDDTFKYLPLVACYGRPGSPEGVSVRISAFSGEPLP